ncbi:uncharacterized protein LOC129216453 [Uloborus diversus]|uniref:uncharacterized protein LOC129216453 n=1 Tax=Uloborus diversus TaxID=327109 RepID=UPI0024094AFB|nr:uncharacterized protein LOC129216453 [Uloborus diversus]
MAFWPDKISSFGLDRLVKRKSKPESDWTTFPIRTLEKGIDLAAVNRKLSFLQQSIESQGHLLALINSKLDQLLTTNHGHDPPKHELSLLDVFPIQTMQDFDCVESELRSGSFQNACIKMIGMTGGSCMKNAVQNIMKKILIDELATQFSFKGQVLGKRCFSSTQLYKIVKHVVQKLFKDASDANMKNIISEWLTQSKFRKSRKEERAKKNNLNASLEEDNCPTEDHDRIFEFENGNTYQVL